MNKELIEKVIQSLTNPHTGKTLFDENRLVSQDFDEAKFSLTYNREGISPGAKREIEDQLIEKLKGVYTEEQIALKTVSSQKVERKVEKVSAGEKKQEAPKQASGLPQKQKIPGVKKVFAVSSCKGGVGKSTVALNLAIALKNSGAKVGLMDADIYGPSVPTLMGMKEMKPMAEEDKIIPFEAHGIKFLTFGAFNPETEPVIWRGPMLGGVLKQFFFDTKWGELDYLIVDLPPGTGDVQLSFCQLTQPDGVIVVSTGQAVSVVDSIKGLNMFEKMKVPVWGMLENMSGFVCDSCDKLHELFGRGKVKEVASKQNISFLGEIPLDQNISTSCESGVPYMSQKKFEGQKVWDSYVKIAQTIDTINERKPKKGLFGFLRR